jgi:hypothetical protein
MESPANHIGGDEHGDLGIPNGCQHCSRASDAPARGSVRDMSTFLETQKLVPLAEIRRIRALLPNARGIYGLFFKVAPGPAPIGNCYVREGLHLLYVGTAGADLSKDGTLRKRLGSQHLGGNERRSTVCLTLAACLPDIAGPAIAKNERGRIKFHTSEHGITGLRSWMDHNMSVCWIEHQSPAELEEALVQQYRPPLNIDFSTHPFAVRLQALRDERRRSCVNHE